MTIPKTKSDVYNKQDECCETNFNDSIGPKRARNSCPKCACGEDEFTFENVTFPDKTAFEDWKRKFEDDNITRSSNREDIPNSHYHIYAM
ncbi:hypothetical protein Y032_0126g1359 [Ancylostoma ceylanicum]|nr:hypothetical protein Y032_0126g1359 [Ancylostoma ceylanicum]